MARRLELVPVSEVRAAEPLAEAVLYDERVRAAFGGTLVERSNKIRSLRVGVDNEVVASLDGESSLHVFLGHVSESLRTTER